MGWAGVWQTVLAQFFAEPALLQIVIALALAFCGLLLIVGLRHVFATANPAPGEAPGRLPPPVEEPLPLEPLMSVTPVAVPPHAEAGIAAPAPAPQAAIAAGRKILPPGLRGAAAVAAKPKPLFRRAQPARPQA